MQDLLKNAGYKVTKARLAILEIFSKNKIPLNAEIVYKKVSAKGAAPAKSGGQGSTSGGKNINEVTVYRTLASLGEAGILKRVDLRKDSVYFELAKEHHHHIVCTKCNDVEDFKNKNLEKVLESIIRSSKFSSKFKLIKEHSLELFGLCRVCLPAKQEGA